MSVLNIFSSFLYAMAKVRDPAIDARLFTNMFVCMRCNAKLRALPRKVEQGKVKCRKCQSKALRLKSKEIRVIGAASAAK